MRIDQGGIRECRGWRICYLDRPAAACSVHGSLRHAVTIENVRQLSGRRKIRMLGFRAVPRRSMASSVRIEIRETKLDKALTRRWRRRSSASSSRRFSLRDHRSGRLSQGSMNPFLGVEDSHRTAACASSQIWMAQAFLSVLS